MVRTVGVDPGFSGAIGLTVDGSDECHAVDMPLLLSDKPGQPKSRKKKKVNKRVDGASLRELFVTMRPDRIVIEQVASRPGQGVVSVFGFGASYGAVCAVADTMGVPVILVPPAKWKRKAGLIGKSKDASLNAAREMYPRVATKLFKRKKDNGRAEAVLISKYA